jgi:hypothetical protein
MPEFRYCVGNIAVENCRKNVRHLDRREFLRLGLGPRGSLHVNLGGPLRFFISTADTFTDDARLSTTPGNHQKIVPGLDMASAFAAAAFRLHKELL